MKRASSLLVILWTVLVGLHATADPQSRVRALSLNALQSQLKRAAAKGERRPELLDLCGITRVTGYLEDRRRRDLILLGEVQEGAPPLHTQDLAVALRAASLKYAVRQGSRLYYQNPGCSIDPDPAVIQQLRDLGEAAQADAFQSRDQQTKLWADICSQPQHVRLLGVPGDSHFAKVMVDADYLMKQLVDGSVSLDLPGFASLTDITLALVKPDLEKGLSPSLPAISLNRFWFYPGKPEFLDQDGLIALEACPVVLLTEEEHLTREGISGKGRPDPLAGQFAQSFSDHYPDIAQRQPIYQELEGLFRFYALAKALRYQKTQANLDYLLQQFPIPATPVARTLPGLSRVSYLESRRDVPGGYERLVFWMPTCGGVAMDFNLGPANFQRAPAGARRPPVGHASSLPTPGAARGRPSSAAGTGKPAPQPTPAPGPRPLAPTRTQILKARPSPNALYWDLPAGR